MIVRLVVVLAALVGLLATAGAALAGSLPGRYIVVLEDGADAGVVAREHARSAAADVSHVYRSALHGYAARLTDEALRRVEADSRVLFVSPDREVSALAQQAPTGVRRIGASTNGVTQTLTTSKGAGVRVAVIDTGIDTSHPDLSVAGGKNCSTGTSYRDGNGHGTHVAGTIAARDNATGVVGIAPAASLYAVRVLNNAGSGSWSSVICGIDWVTGTRTDGVAGNEIAVANMSLGGTGKDDGNCGWSNNDALHKAICRSVANGVTYVVAAGNETDDAANHVPAAYDEVITVSALSDSDGRAGGLGGAPTCRTGERDDYFASFSNFGPDVDIAAPGVCILSTWKGGGYNTISGTSMATPHVTGAAALYLEDHPSTPPADVKDELVAAQEAGPIAGDPDRFKEGVLHVPVS